MRGGKVLPLQACFGEFFLDRPDKLIDEVEVVLTCDSFMSPAKVFGILQPIRIVRADIQDNGKRSFGVNATDEGIEREFADRDSESAHSLVPDAEDALAVGHDNHVDILVRTILQKLGNRVAQRIGDEESAGPAIDVTE